MRITPLKSLAAALIDKLSGVYYGNICALSTEHWATMNVLSLQNKGYITDVDLWLDNLDAPISKALLLALRSMDIKSGYIIQRN